MNPFSPFRQVWAAWPIRAKTKARHFVNWWPWPRSVSPARRWHAPAFLPAIMQLIREEQDPGESEMRLAKMAIANGLTIAGYRQPDFVAAVQREIAQYQRWKKIVSIVSVDPYPSAARTYGDIQRTEWPK